MATSASTFSTTLTDTTQIEASKEIRKQVWFDTPGGEFHWQWSDGRYYGPAGWAGAPQPSTRAAIVLSAVGCSVTEDDAP